VHTVLTPESAVQLIKGLVEIPSLSTHEAAATSWLVEQMRLLGYARAYVDEAGNAIGELGDPGARRVLILLGHIDTVPGVIPVRIEQRGEDQVLHGRGSVDAKGPLAAFVAAGALVGNAWARANQVRILVVGAVEEEYATSKGARWIARRFDGVREPTPIACIIGEPSGWSRVTLGYKGRIAIELDAARPMAHTAGPDAGVATLAVSLWNHVIAFAATYNKDIERAFEQLQPSLRRLHTYTSTTMDDHVEAHLSIRLPLGFDVNALQQYIVIWATTAMGVAPEQLYAPVEPGQGSTLQLASPEGTLKLHFHAYEPAWRSERSSPLVRSFLGSIRGLDVTVRPTFLVKTGTADMNVVAPIWQCPIVAYGPGDSSLDHTPNEHLSLTEYWKSIQILETCIRDFTSFPQ